jgi:hypothetical protein
MEKIRLTNGKHFHGNCGSSNWREAGEEFEAIITEEETHGIKEVLAEVRTPFMQESIILRNNEFQTEFEMIKETNTTEEQLEENNKREYCVANYNGELAGHDLSKTHAILLCAEKQEEEPEMEWEVN